MKPPQSNAPRIDLGASSAHRWLTCTASPQYLLDVADQLPKRETDEYADEGKEAHALAAARLLGQPDPFVPSSEMDGYVNGYVEFVRSHRCDGDIFKVEQPLNLFYLPERTGIADAVIIRPDAVVICDLKYGVGVSVDAEFNPQLAIYGESVIQSWEQIMSFPDDMPVMLKIYQPRDRNNPVPEREWTITRKELRDNGEAIQATFTLIQQGKVEFKASEKGCQFCPAKGLCSTYALQGLVALPEEARVIELPHPGTLPREKRVEVLKAKKVLAQWLEALEDQEVSDLMNGSPSIGLKLVEGKSNRQWADEEAALKLLSNHLTMDELRPRASLISPHKAEVALKGLKLSSRFTNKLTGLITKPEGAPTLVPETDPRPALSFEPNNGLKPLD